MTSSRMHQPAIYLADTTGVLQLSRMCANAANPKPLQVQGRAAGQQVRPLRLPARRGQRGCARHGRCHLRRACAWHAITSVVEIGKQCSKRLRAA